MYHTNLYLLAATKFECKGDVMNETRCTDAYDYTLGFLKYENNVTSSCTDFEEKLYTINKKREDEERGNIQIDKTIVN